MSPNAMNEEERRDLIARQHRALYGQESSLYPSDGSAPRPSQDARAAGQRGPSPLAFDPFGMQQQQTQAGAEPPVQMPARDHAAMPTERKPSTSPTSAGRSNFGGLTDTASQPTGTGTTSPVTSPSIGGGSMPSIAAQSGIAPIGSRPNQAPGTAKRSITPNERSASAASNSNAADKSSGLGTWGSSSGVWGASKNSLGVQASVWG